MKEKDFNNFLDESYNKVWIEGVEIYCSAILKNCDPIAYDQAYYNWCDSMDRERTENDQK